MMDGSFDINCALGHATIAHPQAPRDAAGLVREMDRVRIADALVYSVAAAHYHAPTGNAELIHAIRDHPRLHPCWVVLPDATGEFPSPAGLIDDMRRHHVRAARLFPG